MAWERSLPTPPDTVTLARATYLQWLTWLFTLFDSVRVLAYLPTIWSIESTGDSSQRSLVTWPTQAGTNTTMAAWLC